MKKQSSQLGFRVVANVSPFGQVGESGRGHIRQLAPLVHGCFSQITHFSFTRSLQRFHVAACKERGNQEAGSGPYWTCARSIASQPAQPSNCMPSAISRRKISS